MHRGISPVLEAHDLQSQRLIPHTTTPDPVHRISCLALSSTAPSTGFAFATLTWKRDPRGSQADDRVPSKSGIANQSLRSTKCTPSSSQPPAVKRESTPPLPFARQTGQAAAPLPCKRVKRGDRVRSRESGGPTPRPLALPPWVGIDEPDGRPLNSYFSSSLGHGRPSLESTAHNSNSALELVRDKLIVVKGRRQSAAEPLPGPSDRAHKCAS